MVTQSCLVVADVGEARKKELDMRTNDLMWKA